MNLSEAISITHERNTEDLKQQQQQNPTDSGG